MNAYQNAEAMRRNALSDLRWYAWRMVHYYRLNGGLIISKDDAINFCGSAEALAKDRRLMDLKMYYGTLSYAMQSDSNFDIQQTVTITRDAWRFVHQFDEMLSGEKLPIQ